MTAAMLLRPAVGAILLVLPASGAAQSATPVPTDRFPVGETLVYEAKFGFITLGVGMMRVAGIDTIRGTPTLHTTFALKGGPFFYKLDDRMDSWFGLADFASRRFVQDFDEGGNKRYTAYEIFPDSGFYREGGVDSTMATSPDPLDDTAFFYFVRSVPLEEGKTYTFDRYFRPDRNPVTIEVVGRETLDVPAGRYATIVVRPIIKGRGILAESQNPRVWLSDDDRRLIVQLKSTFPFGTIALRLKDVTDTPPPELADKPK